MGRQTLGDLQHAIMAVLWDRGEATTADVHEALHAERGLALTTIATMLRKMEDKGVVAHRAEGRQFVYRPTVTRAAIRESMVGELVERVFGGDAKALVAHLVSEHEIDPKELDELRRRLDSSAKPGSEPMSTVTAWLLTYLLHSIRPPHRCLAGPRRPAGAAARRCRRRSSVPRSWADS